MFECTHVIDSQAREADMKPHRYTALSWKLSRGCGDVDVGAERHLEN